MHRLLNAVVFEVGVGVVFEVGVACHLIDGEARQQVTKERAP